jgi:peroxiredoxin
LLLTELSLVAVRLLLAVVFLVAGVAKLANRAESRQALRDFGLPMRLAQPFGTLLPPLEITVAVSLLFAASAWYGASAALVLLGMFTAGIAGNLVRGRQPACNCFGQLHSVPISWRTLLRNGLLAACAVWLIAGGRPQPSADLWVFLRGLDSRGRRIAMVVAAVIGFVVLNTFRQETPDDSEQELAEEPASAMRPRAEAIAAVGARPDLTPAEPTARRKVLTGNGLPIGTEAPEFDLPDLTGARHSLASLRGSGRSLLLLFSSPFCEPCQALAPQLPGLTAVYEQAFRLVLVSKGTAEQNLKHLKDASSLLVLFQENFEVAESYDCTSSPSAVHVGADGLIRSKLATGQIEIKRLMASIPASPSSMN